MAFGIPRNLAMIGGQSFPSQSPDDGIFSYLARAMRPLPFNKMGKQDPSAPPSAPRAVASPEGGGVVTPGPTKQDMGGTPPLTPLPSHGPGYTPGRTVPPPTPPHIRYAVPDPVTGEMGEMRDYDSSRGIEAFAGQGGVGFDTRGEGVEGRPGGGAFTPSPTPVIGRTPGPQGVPIFNWDGIANPMAFEAYSDPLLATELEAKRVAAERAVADPLWDEREKAKIWMDTQVGVQKGIQSLMMENFMSELQKIKMEIDREFPNLPPEEKQKILDQRSQILETAYRNVFGERGAGSSIRSYGGFPD